MKLRQQLPVLSPIEPSALVGALAPMLTASAAPLHALSATLRERHGATTVVLTDSGTSALIVALRIAAGKRGTVAFPGYACIDLAAAARFANVKVRLYDVQPSTLSPDLDSLRATLRRGVNAVVVAHLFGYPADVPAVTALAREEGAAVIEDAAQSAGGSLGGKRLGSLGALSLLSFGRGKGMTGGNGGALMATDPEWNRALGDAGAALGTLRAGWPDLAVAAAQWA
ncbi:MAG: DegT/DnrJ/EryC1/StrS family aminotransferase, partial [Gemmatimonadaceae bacterium]